MGLFTLFKQKRLGFKSENMTKLANITDSSGHIFIKAVLVLIVACNNKVTEQRSSDSSKTVHQVLTDDSTKKESKRIWTDRLNGQQYPLPDSINGKPVSFYINHPKVALIAKALYKGQFRPGDNDSTTELLSYITTEDSTIRPFYRWCLDFTISISDGALGEYPGSPALDYAMKYPKEFFDYMDKDVSGQRYKKWTEIIVYSGLPDYTKKPEEIEKGLINNINKSCYSCDVGTISLISAFAKDISTALKHQD
jgi:hypothetical protein